MSKRSRRYLECAGRAQRRRRFNVPFKSGVVLRVPPQSKSNALSILTAITSNGTGPSCSLDAVLKSDSIARDEANGPPGRQTAVEAVDGLRRGLPVLRA